MKLKLLLFLLLSNFAYASFDINKNIQNSYKHIINLEFEEAHDLLELESENNPNNGFIPLHKNYIDFLTILISEDKSYFEIAEKQKELRLDLLVNAEENSPYYLYVQAEVHLQWAFSRLKFDEYSTATYEFIKAYKLLEKNQEKFPDFVLNKKGLGLIHSILGAVPEQFQWILNLAGLEGGIALGLSELNEVLNSEECKLYETEILFLLSFLQINLTENDKLNQEYLDRIGERYKDNLLLNFATALLSHNLGLNDYCLNVLESRPSNKGKLPFYYLDYLQGMSYLYKLDYENAQNKFEYFSVNFKGVNYIKSAYHKLAWIAFLQKNSEKKNEYFAKVISEGNTSIDEDKVAMKDAEGVYFSSPVLLKARLLYDGGYYEKALNQIIAFEQIDNIEYWYRLARVKSKLDYKNNEIIAHYQKSYDLGKESTAYYAPMSALQIALIYEKQNELDKAAIYFEKCLSMEGFDYERGIHQNAKSGLVRISD